MAKLASKVSTDGALPPAISPRLLGAPAGYDQPPRTELFLQEDAGFIVERMGDDGVGGPIEWIDEEFPRVWRKDI